jgi:DNA polymerase III subunit delta'
VSPRRPPEADGRRRLVPLSQILGQEPVVEMLRQALTTGKLHHALLFVGPEGVGKGTTAFALAARLLCGSPVGDDACGRCAACAQVRAGSHADFRCEGFFFDERKKDFSESMVIEQMRGLQSFLGGRALAGGRKVAILEEAHALTEEAQNALLKTLEEPPRGSLIVLVCHNASRLQLTVRSRCQRVAFAPLAPAVIETILRRSLELPDEEARFLATHSEGSLAFAADPTLFREAHERVVKLLTRVDARSYVAAAAAAKELLSTTKGVPLDLKVLLGLLRRRMRARAGLEDSAQLTRSDKTGTLADTLHALEAAYGAVVDLGRNANRRLATERMWLRIGESMD